MEGVDLVGVTKEEELVEIYALTYESYLRAGLIEVKEDTRVIHHPHFDRWDQTYIITAKKEGKTIGTISITLDSKRGLPVDNACFHQNVEQLREMSNKLAHTWRNAIHPDYSNNFQLLFTLIQKATDIVYEKEVNHILFTFAPKHARIYEKLLHLKPLAKGEDDNVEILPEQKEVVLMGVAYEDLPEKWTKHHACSVV